MHGDTPSPLFLDLARRLRALGERIVETETAMGQLARNYALKMSPCRLVLYPKIERARRGGGPNPRFDGGRPRGIYWGRVTWTHVVIHLKGRLTNAMVWQLAHRGEQKHLFYAFERERLRLNRTRTMLVKAREDLRKILRRYADLPSARAVSSFLADLRPLGVRHLPLVRGLFELAREGQAILERMESLVARFRAASDGSARLLLRMVNARNRIRRLYIGIRAAMIPAERISRGLLDRAGLDPDAQEILFRYRREAVALNRAASDHRARLAHVRRVLRCADVKVARRRRRRRRKAVT